MEGTMRLPKKKSPTDVARMHKTKKKIDVDHTRALGCNGENDPMKAPKKQSMRHPSTSSGMKTAETHICLSDDDSTRLLSSSASTASEASTLLECFDTDAMIASPLTHKQPIEKSEPEQRPKMRPSIDRRDSEKRWKTICTDEDEKNLKKATVETEIAVDDAIQVGLAVLGALKTSHDGCEGRAIDGTQRQKRAGKKDEILNHVHQLIAKGANHDEKVALNTLVKTLGSSMSGWSLGSVDSATTVPRRGARSTGPEDGLPTIPLRRQSNECMSIDADGMSKNFKDSEMADMDDSIPSLVDIESPDLKREKMKQNTSCSLIQLSLDGLLIHSPRKLSPSSKQGRDSGSPLGSSTLDGRLSRANRPKVCTSASPGCLRPSDNEKDLSRSDLFGERPVGNPKGRHRSSSKPTRTRSLTNSKNHASREYNRSQSDRNLSRRSFSAEKRRLSSEVCDRKNARGDTGPSLHRSDCSISSDGCARRSITKKEIRKCLSETRLGVRKCSFPGESYEIGLDQHLVTSPRKGRRPRSERSLGSSSKISMGSRRASNANENQAVATHQKSASITTTSKRRPDRPHGKRSLSLDAVQTRSVSKIPEESKTQEVAKPRPSLVQSKHWGSLRNLSLSGESARKLDHSGGSLRNLAAVGASLFRRNERYMDIDREGRTILDASTDERLANISHSKSTTPAMNRYSENLHLLPPPPPPPPAESQIPGKLTPKLKPSKKDSLPYSSPGSHHRRSTKSLGKLSSHPRKSLSLSHIDTIQSPVPSKPAAGDAAVASMAWEPSSAPATKKTTKRRAKKGEQLKRLLHLQAWQRGAPLADQQSSEDEEIIIPLHFLDAKREFTRKHAVKRTSQGTTK
jgi:hypothetical protein